MRFSGLFLTFTVAFLVALPQAFSFTPYTPPAPRVQQDCWFCEVTDGDMNWYKYAETKSQAYSASLQACKKETSKRARSCKPEGQCMLKKTYSNCGSAGSYEIHSSDDYTPAPAPTPWPDQDENQCSSNIECNGFDICVKNECVSKDGINNQCFTNLDCGFPYDCVNGRCGRYGEDGCRFDSDCSIFQACSAGQCVNKDSFSQSCFGDYNCPVFHTCRDGKCIAN